MRLVGARAEVRSVQLNGKQKGLSRQRRQPDLRCPRNGRQSSHEPVFVTPLVLSATGFMTDLGRSHRLQLPSPDTGQQGSGALNGAPWRFAQGLRGRRQGTCLLIPIMFSLNTVRVAPGLRSALAVACGLALSASCEMAWADEAVAPVVVTANREPQPIQKVMADVTVVTRDDIERQAGTAVADVLKTLPGFEIVRNGDVYGTSGVFLRGAESRHLLVLIDGVRLDTQSGSGGATWEALPLSEIDRIEIVRGPASAIYGSDAVAGVVQIFTRKGQGPLRMTLGMGVGSHGLIQSDVSLSGGHDAWSYSLGGAISRASGFDTRSNTKVGTQAEDNDDYRASSAHAGVGYRLSERQSFHISLLTQHSNAGYDSSVSSKVDDRSVQDLDSVSAAWVAQWLDAWRSTVTVGQANSRYETRPSVYVTRTEVRNASWANQITVGEHTVRATLEGREDRLKNTSVPADRDVQRDGALGLGYDWQGRDVSVQTSIREDHHSAFGEHVTGSVGAAYDLSKQWRIRGSWGTAFRAPTLYQRFSPYGQANLQPEIARTSELGLQYHSGSLQWGVTVFNSRVEDLINYDSPGVCASTWGCYRNVGRATLRGVELSGAATWAGVRWTGAFNLDDPRNAETDTLLARRARQHGSVRAETSWAQWMWGAQAQWSGQRFDDASNLNRLGGYALLGVDAQKDLNQNWKLILRVDNLTDKRYETARTYSTSGRAVFAGVRWTPDL